MIHVFTEGGTHRLREDGREGVVLKTVQKFELGHSWQIRRRHRGRTNAPVSTTGTAIKRQAHSRMVKRLCRGAYQVSATKNSLKLPRYSTGFRKPTILQNCSGRRCKTGDAQLLALLKIRQRTRSYYGLRHFTLKDAKQSRKWAKDQQRTGENNQGQ